MNYKMEIITLIQTILPPIVAAIAAYFAGKLKENAKKDEARTALNESIKDGLRAVLQFRILLSYNYYVRQKYIPTQEMTSITAMYKAYHSLGGNGMITQIYNEMMGMPHFKER